MKVWTRIPAGRWRGGWDIFKTILKNKGFGLMSPMYFFTFMFYHTFKVSKTKIFFPR